MWLVSWNYDALALMKLENLPKVAVLSNKIYFLLFYVLVLLVVYRKVKCRVGLLLQI